MPDRKVAWAATEGATNAGAVTFEDVGGGQTSVHLPLEYEPEGLLEKVGDKLNIVENQAEADLDRFKAFIEAEGDATGAWRGSVNAGAASHTPGPRPAARMATPARLVCRARRLPPDWAPQPLVAFGAAAAAGKKAARPMTPVRRSVWMWESHWRLRPPRPAPAGYRTR